MPSDLILRLGAAEFAGWKNVSVTRTIEAGSGSFALGVSERNPVDPSKREIRPGLECEVWLAEQRVIAGYVDSVSRAFDASQHEISVAGRDKVSDLIDCAPDVSPGEWQNVTVLDVTRELAALAGITVRADAPVGDPYERIVLGPGQRSWELIEERCRYRQLLPISDGAGGLLLTRAGSARCPVALIEGVNILGGSAEFTHTERHRRIVVKGQSSGSDFAGEALSIAPSGDARDAEIRSTRELTIVAGSSVDPEKAQKRAAWEVINRAARGARAQVVVQGWTQPSGLLWPINALVQVQSETLGIFGEMLISGATYELGESGSRTTLSLVRPDAFLPPPDREAPMTSLGFGAPLPKQQVAAIAPQESVLIP